MAFNNKYYFDGSLHQLRPATSALSTFLTTDNIVIGMFQGERGGNPLLDFKVRILLDGENNTPILPPHTYWVVDLMLKCVNYKEEVKEIADYYLDFYENCVPFQTQQARVNYQPQTLGFITTRYSNLVDDNSLSIEYVAIIIELFCLNEKQTIGAFWFKNLLQKLSNYASGAANYIDLLESAQAGKR